ncbi:Maf family protein [Hyphobacterium marinum]|uniref:Nucleoside triphosphate pyrophosphatase n=1 Tax=Hyphobacterium marinum TaxID=3116574 RepID=A0ABU7LUY6_9PROT|nr:Maf family nucleotide pyrophosphatase [Hyphobacterium sp. Y6023]MEE2565377.1 Maf family nucleotide pyrophosphatase [Hyphobacterium sp. Y6023]
MSAHPFILASGSQIRQSLLRNAGVDFTVAVSRVDEAAIKARHAGTGPDELALILAEAKAKAVSANHPGALVLGADQILSLDGVMYDKAENRADARNRLADLRGKTHGLHGGLAALRDGQTVWTHSETSLLTVRAFSDAFLESYLDQAGDELTASVGSYAYEGLGAQLFEEIKGDYFAILGLPLLPVLAMLREEGVLAS